MALASAAADTVLFDLKGSDLGGAMNPTSVSLTVSDITAKIDVTSGNGTLVGGDWNGATVMPEGATAPSGNQNLVAPAPGTTAYDFIKGSGTTVPPTLTFSGLTAGSVYNISIETGVPFEKGGDWNTHEPADGFAYTSASLTTSSTTQELISLTEKGPVKEVGTFSFTSVRTNEEEKIAFNLTYGETHCHSVSFNSDSVTLVPEPTTATLSLLALAGLAARRRRK